ncbi:hypothetical protein ACFX2I_019589 [Malus domestica]
MLLCGTPSDDCKIRTRSRVSNSEASKSRGIGGEDGVAEVIADVALCPFEAVKVRVQTQPGFARGLSDRFPKFVRSESALG